MTAHGTVLPNIDPVRTQLDLPWTKVHNALAQEAEGRKGWIEGTLELSTILGDARKRYDSDQAFSAWLTEHGYGEDRLTRRDRQALINMALDLNVTRNVLQETHRRSWRLIWEEEVKPRLPSGGQPAADAEQAKEAQTNTSRPRKKGTRKPKEEWGKDLKDFMSDGLLAANALVRIMQSIRGCLPEKQAELLKKVTSEWSDKIDEGKKASAWISDWANGLLEAEADALIQQDRVVKTPALASKQNQQEA
jgi:hypothetical protein